MALQLPKRRFHISQLRVKAPTAFVASLCAVAVPVAAALGGVDTTSMQPLLSQSSSLSPQRSAISGGGARGLQSPSPSTQSTASSSPLAKLAGPSPLAAPTIPPVTVSAGSIGSALFGRSFFADPYLVQRGRPEPIASSSAARWIGDWSTDVTGEVNEYVAAATSAGKLPVLVAYNIPARDCGGYSAGGAGSSDAYGVWIRQFAAGIGQRQAVVILEPDALGAIDCLSSRDQAKRYANIADAVHVLVSSTKSYVYIDAGHYAWQSAATMADRLGKAGVGEAQGFALNVSNFGWTDKSATYGATIAKKIGGKHFVIDTSRNGNGPAADKQWCNPAGRALGPLPTGDVSQPYLDAYLWIKTPGESDGTCAGGPAAGVWWPEYAQALIKNAGY